MDDQSTVANPRSRGISFSGWHRIFPADGLGTADYLLAGTLLAACFLLFFQGDVLLIGSCSLNFLFGSPLEFYENCLRYHPDYLGSCPYPATTYAVFALWLMPLKLLGIVTGPDTFPVHASYWLKVLTTLTYFASSFIFYKISLHYSPSKAWAKYASVVWLVTPLGVFSQFIFSQCDIFYVFMTLIGFLMFIRQRLHWAALCFGVAITFKYFPAFVFAPLLLLAEKRILRLAAPVLIFAAPLGVLNLIYHSSAAYTLTVTEYAEVGRIYGAVLDVGWPTYYLIITFTVLCGIAYFTPAESGIPLKPAACIWLIASTFPFLFIVWHPQWLLFATPPIVLTSMLSRRLQQFMVLDLAGMLAFIAASAIIFVGNVDTAMFRADMVGSRLDYAFLMRDLFTWFGAHSQGVYVSAFTGYLILQIGLKCSELWRANGASPQPPHQYGDARLYFYLGLLIFLVPAASAIVKDKASDIAFIDNYEFPKDFKQQLSGRIIEQTFVAEGSAIARVVFPRIAFSEPYDDDLLVEILDDKGTPQVSLKQSVANLANIAWQSFVFQPTRVSRGAQYTVRLTRLGSGNPGIRMTVPASVTDTYRHGHAVVDGVVENYDLAFRVGFTRSGD